MPAGASDGSCQSLNLRSPAGARRRRVPRRRARARRALPRLKPASGPVPAERENGQDSAHPKFASHGGRDPSLSRAARARDSDRFGPAISGIQSFYYTSEPVLECPISSCQHFDGNLKSGIRLQATGSATVTARPGGPAAAARASHGDRGRRLGSGEYPERPRLSACAEQPHFNNSR